MLFVSCKSTTQSISQTMRISGIIGLLTIFFFFGFNQAEQLKCYVCNSQFQNCGFGTNFDGRKHSLTYCSGYCMKITLSPGDFVIRTCSTLFNSLTTRTNISSIIPEPQQCYISSFTNIGNAETVPAYYCYCNDQGGCNQATRLLNVHKSIVIFCFLLSQLFFL